MRNLIYSVLFTSLLFASCRKDESNTIRVITSGNQESFQHFYLNVASVQVNYEMEDGKTFWYILDSQEGLKDFASDDQWLLGSKNELPDGNVKEFRLVLKEGNYFEKNGSRVDLQNKGVDKVITVNRPVSGGSVDLVLDLALEQSVVEKSRNYFLSPQLSVQ